MSGADTCAIRECDEPVVAEAMLIWPASRETLRFCDRHWSLSFVEWERISDG